ncbi:MAG: hypothetical protein FWD26_08810 [Treponema sp.]|nr:hypothetical protein [Treponema sp.]
MRKFTLKNVFYTIFLTAILAGCIEPVDLDDFLDDDDVKDYIERNRVNLIDNTGDNLLAENTRIFGLIESKYYRIEAKNEDGVQISGQTGYITADGVISQIFADIGRVKDRIIPNLNNTYTYTIWAAEPVIKTLPLYDCSQSQLSVTVPQSVTSTNNGLILEAQVRNYYLDIASVYDSFGTLTNTLRYSVSPTAASVEISCEAAPHNTKTRLRGANTLTDYLFYGTDEDGEKKLSVLRILIHEAPPSEGSRIILTLLLTDGLHNFNPQEVSITQAALFDGNVISLPEITINDPSEYDSIRWLYSNYEIETGGTLDLKEVFANTTEGGDPRQKGHINYLAIGRHLFTVEAVLKENGRPYSASFAVVVE